MTEEAAPNDVRQRGLDMMEQVYGWKITDYPGDHFSVTVEHLFADIWSRPGLSIRDRRLILLGALSAQGLFDIAGVQMGAALGNEELTEEELREIALFLCHYIGWPAGTKFDGMIGKIAAQAKKSAAAKVPDLGYEKK